MQIRIEQDVNGDGPREDDNLGTMVCFHKRYKLGDKDHGYNFNDYISWDGLQEAIAKQEDTAAILPIYMYDHGGITINTGGFSCPWDSGQIGFIFISKAKAREAYGWKLITQKRMQQLEDMLRGEIATYDQYLTGDVWGYIIEDDDGNYVDSCWGFYGREECEQEAQSIREALSK